jgi:hypothetical protein
MDDIGSYSSPNINNFPLLRAQPDAWLVLTEYFHQWNSLWLSHSHRECNHVFSHKKILQKICGIYNSVHHSYLFSYFDICVPYQNIGSKFITYKQYWYIGCTFHHYFLDNCLVYFLLSLSNLTLSHTSQSFGYKFGQPNFSYHFISVFFHNWQCDKFRIRCDDSFFNICSNWFVG